MPHHPSQTSLNGGLILNFIATETNGSDEYAGKIILCFVSITFALLKVKHVLIWQL